MNMWQSLVTTGQATLQSRADRSPITSEELQ